jgi:hypothetical protein
MYIAKGGLKKNKKITGGRSAQKMVGKSINKVKSTKIGFLTVYS